MDHRLGAVDSRSTSQGSLDEKEAGLSCYTEEPVDYNRGELSMRDYVDVKLPSVDEPIRRPELYRKIVRTRFSDSRVDVVVDRCRWAKLKVSFPSSTS